MNDFWGVTVDFIDLSVVALNAVHNIDDLAPCLV